MLSTITPIAGTGLLEMTMPLHAAIVHVAHTAGDHRTIAGGYRTSNDSGNQNGLRFATEAILSSYGRTVQSY